MPKDLIRLNNSQACAACNPLHRRRVLMVSLSFTELIRKHVSFQPPEACSLHAVWAKRPASTPPPLSFFLILLSFVLSTSTSLSFSLFLDLPSCTFDSSEGNYDESGRVGTKSAFPSSNERTNYSLPFFILSTLFLIFRWCPRPCCFCKCWNTFKIFMNLWPWLTQQPNTNSWTMCLPYAESKWCFILFRMQERLNIHESFINNVFCDKSTFL